MKLVHVSFHVIAKEESQICGIFTEHIVRKDFLQGICGFVRLVVGADIVGMGGDPETECVAGPLVEPLVALPVVEGDNRRWLAASIRERHEHARGRAAACRLRLLELPEPAQDVLRERLRTDPWVTYVLRRQGLVESPIADWLDVVERQP